MSRFGGQQTFQNDFSEALEKRAKEVGNQQAMREAMDVLSFHCECCWHEPDAKKEKP